jgi:hypothetical protein
MKREQKCVASTTLALVCFVMLTAPAGTVAHATESSIAPPPIQAAQPTPEQLQQLVAPIALYPDSVVAQMLAAATYPEQVVEAERWMQSHGDLKGEQLAQQVDEQPWDSSVKALTEFPSVLANMDKNLSWTSSLGDAYVNHQQDVMDAIQVMRERAQASGNLDSTPQQRVIQQDQTIVIEPADPQIVYVPVYDPWLVYGGPIVAWPGWYWYPGLFVPGPGIAFGFGFDIGFFSGFGWGCHHWGSDWHHRRIVFDHHTFVSHSRTFVNRSAFERDRARFGGGGEFRPGRESGFRGGQQHGVAAPHDRMGGRIGGSRPDRSGPDRGSEFRPGPGSAGAERAEPRGFPGGQQHAVGAPREPTGGRWGAFSGIDRGGVTRGDSSRGSSSFGGHSQGGGGFGGGGFHGGGGGGGGGGRR